MGMPMGALKRVMTQREFAEWCWAYHAEPFDDQSCHHLPAAMQTSTWVNTKLKPGATPFSPLDFMPFSKKPDSPEPDIDSLVIGRF